MSMVSSGPHKRQSLGAEDQVLTRQLYPGDNCSSSSLSDSAISIPFILHMNEDQVWSLPKSELRRFFLALQDHSRCNLQDLALSQSSNPATLSTVCYSNSSPFLSLPLEIRNLIFTHLLSLPESTPIKGPHPRQLQTQLCFSRAFCTAVLRVNHQVSREALAVFYGAPTQWIHITIDYNVWSHKVQRSNFLMSSHVTAAMRHFHIYIYLGNEKRTSRPLKEESDARLAVVRKGARKVGKWLSGTKVRSLRISWHEPQMTYVWEQKKDILDEFRVLRSKHVEVGVINWGLKKSYSGKKYLFREEYLRELEQSHGYVQNPMTGVASPM